MAINFETLKASLILYGLNAFYAIILLIVGWYLAGIAQRVVTRVLTVTHRVDPLVTAFLASLARYGVLAVVGISVLQLFGIQTASLVAVLGATSLAIGLALQGTLSNLAAGVMLLLFRPFSVGDEVEVAGRAGKVRSLSLFMTELVAPDNTQILLPNASVWGTAIINHSAYPGTGELKVSFPVQADAAETVGREILNDLRNDPRLDRSVEPAVHVSRVMEISAPDFAVVELTVNARVKPAEADAVRQTVLDRVNKLLVSRREPVPADAAE
jgi:small conductance mechanosensitive channel